MFSNFGPFFTRRFVVFSFRRKSLLKVFWNSEGVAKKQRKARFVFLLSRVWFFVQFREIFVSSWSPFVYIYLVVCKCVIHPCFLGFVVMIFSLLWSCFIVSTNIYLYCVLYVLFCCFSLLYSFFVCQKPDQIT